MLRLGAPVGFGTGWGLRTGAVHKDRVTAGAGNPEGRESRWEASSGNGGAEGGCGRLRPHHPALTQAGSPETTVLDLGKAERTEPSKQATDYTRLSRPGPFLQRTLSPRSHSESLS